MKIKQANILFKSIFMACLCLFVTSQVQAQTFTKINGNFNDINSYWNNPTIIDIDGNGLMDLLMGEQRGRILHYEQDSVNSTSFTQKSSSFNNIDLEYSTAPTFTDLDGDGLLDLLIGYENANDDGYIKHYEQHAQNSTAFILKEEKFNSIQFDYIVISTFADLDGNGLLDMLVGDGDGSIHHYEQNSVHSTSFNEKNSTFCNIDVGFCAAPTIVDMDNDGLLDLLIGQSNGKIWHFSQDEQNSTSFTLITENFNSIYENHNASPALTDLDGDQKLDLLIASDGMKHYEANSSTINISVSTSNASSVNQHTAILGGAITGNKNAHTRRGVVYSTENSTPVLTDNIAVMDFGVGTFSDTITNLLANSTYYFRSFSSGPLGTFYGLVKTFTTPKGTATISTTEASNVTHSSATIGGNVLDNGGYSINEKGICYSTSENPTLTDAHIASENSEDSYTITLNSLEEGIYYAKAYATNEVGTSYGEQQSFEIKITYQYITNNFNSISGDNLKPTFIDIDGNGLLDLLVGEQYGCIYHYEQSAVNSTEFTKKSSAFNGIDVGFHSAPTFTDLDGNGLLDLLIGNTYGEINHLEQVKAGSIAFTQRTVNFNGIDVGNYAAPTFTDLDGDGLLDLLIGEYGGEIRHFEQNSPNSTTFTHRTDRFCDIDVGMIAAPTIADIDNDGLLDLLIGEPNGHIRHYEQNKQHDTIFNFITDEFNSIYAGSYAAPAFADLDGDKRLDLLTGSSGNGCTLYESELSTINTNNVNGNTSSAGFVSATISVEITDDNALFNRCGIALSTSNEEPGFNDSIVFIGSHLGESSKDIENLEASTTYFYHAFSSSSAGTFWAEETQSFTTDNGIPTLSTTDTSDITAISASSGGNITNDGGTPIIARGICWSQNENPSMADNYTSDGEGTGEFTSSLTNLTPNTTYFARAYATTDYTTSYGQQKEFTTRDAIPTLTTTEITDITAISASSGGDITDNGGAPIITRGVCWSLSENPTLTDSLTNNGDGLGEFLSNLNNLLADTTYYIRAYASTAYATSYGEQKELTTLDGIPTLYTDSDVTNVASTMATCGGRITYNGGAPITERGLCWSDTTAHPTIANSHVVDDSTGTGDFTSQMTGLEPGTTYYVKAYATNAVTTEYGANRTFTTDDVPSVSINNIFVNDSTFAICSAEVTSDNGDSVTTRGICWSTTSLPTLNDNVASNGSDSGVYDCEITGLSVDTRYYVRAYATNAVGTNYSDQIEFNTPITIQNAFHFDGTDDYSETNFTLTESGTIEAWVKRENTSFSVFDGGSELSTWYFYYDNGYKLRIGNSSYIHTDAVDTKWHHVAVTWTKTFTTVSFQIYIDGNLEAYTVYGNTWTDPANSLFIGSSYNGTSNFEGNMDEFRVWNYAKTSTQINADMHNTVDPESLGLLCYYQFNQSNGNSFNDATANVNNAVVHNNEISAWETSTAPFGDLGFSVRSEATTTIGTSGKSLNMLMSSTDTRYYFTGIYATGDGENEIVSETFPSQIEKRPSIIWGAYRFGNGTNDPYADITIDYSNLNIADEAARLMKRFDAISEWEDVTDSATQNTTNHTFTLDYQTTFCEYSIGEITPECPAPSEAATSINFGSVTPNTIVFSDFTAPTNGASGYAIYVNSSDSWLAPNNGDEPIADLIWDNDGQQCIYFGTSVTPNISISNLDAATTYYFKVYAYNVCSGNEAYETTGVGANTSTIKLDQTITFNPISELTYGDSDYTLSANASSELDVIFSSSDNDIASILNGQIVIEGAGTCTIYADQEGNESYNAAPQVSQTITIEKAELNVIVDNKSKDYGDTNPTFTISYSGFVNGDDENDLTTEPSATCTADESSDVGDYDITLSGGSDENYNLTLYNGTLTIDKADQPAPATPTLANKTANSVTLNTVANCEYNVNGGTWQSSATFSGLSASTTYSFRQRCVESTNYNASPASTVLNVTTNESTGDIPEFVSIVEQTFTSEDNECYGATNEIVVAEDGNPVEFQSGSSTNFIAQQSIRFLPGTVIRPGAYVHACITDDGTFCDGLPESIVRVKKPETKSLEIVPEKEDELELKTLKVYPNPSDGRFTIGIRGAEGSNDVVVYNNMGQLVKELKVWDKGKVEMFDIQKGIYLVKVKNSSLFQRIVIR